jgi:hypothetical protein
MKKEKVENVSLSDQNCSNKKLAKLIAPTDQILG